MQADACVEVNTNLYSVPWRLISTEVSVVVGDDGVRIHHAGIEVVCHDEHLGRRERAVDRADLHGIVPCRPDPADDLDIVSRSPTVLPSTDLLRPLAEYGQATGAGKQRSTSTAGQNSNRRVWFSGQSHAVTPWGRTV